MLTLANGAPAAAGAFPDRVGEFVLELGAVAALYRLEDAERHARGAAQEARDEGRHGAADGYVAAADALRAQQFELVERFA